MSPFCRIGLHRWTFDDKHLDEPGHRTHTEITRARCRRENCTRYGRWRLVHQEVHVPGPSPHESSVSTA